MYKSNAMFRAAVLLSLFFSLVGCGDSTGLEDNATNQLPRESGCWCRSPVNNEMIRCGLTIPWGGKTMECRSSGWVKTEL
ncbi:MAG: hypothetical protein AB2745_14245 [Candidatus Thiodiazotropha endolucinida]